jgi:hypothetical protein
MTYLVPEEQADAYLDPPMPMGPNTWDTLREPLPGSMIHRVDVLDTSELEPHQRYRFASLVDASRR